LAKLVERSPVDCGYTARLQIPGVADRSFQAKPITDSEASRSRIPIEADHPLRRSRSPVTT